MIVGGELGDGLLLLDLGLFGLARVHLVRSRLLAGRVGSGHGLALAHGSSSTKEIIDVQHAIIRGDQGRRIDVFEGFVLFGQELHVIDEENCGEWVHSILVSLDLVQEGRDMTLHKSQCFPFQF